MGDIFRFKEHTLREHEDRLDIEAQKLLLKAYVHRATRDTKIEKRFIEAFDPYVLKVYQDYFSNFKIFSDDLIQEGRMGLLRAAEKYRDDSKAHFSSFANQFIWGSMLRWLQRKNQLLKIPRTDLEDFFRFTKDKAGFDDEQDPPIATEEMERMRLIRDALNINLQSLDLLHEQESVRPEFIKEPDQVDELEEEIMLYDILSLVSTLDNLTENEKKVLEMHLVLRDKNNRPITFKEISDRIGISQMHVGRLWKQAIRKMAVAIASQEYKTRERKKTTSLDVLDVGAQARNILRRAEIDTIEGLVDALKKNPTFCYQLEGMSIVRIEEIVKALQAIGIKALYGKINGSIIIDK